LRQITPKDFPEIALRSVQDISPGLQLAKNQSRVSAFNGHLNNINIDPDWNIDMEYFRRILTLTLASPGRENVLRAIRFLERRDDIFSAEPNFYKRLAPALIGRYNQIVSCEECCIGLKPSSLESRFTNISIPWGVNRINAPAAWRLINSPSLVRVGVLDTGICANHPDIRDRLDIDLFRNFTVDGECVLSDYSGHGTHVAGTIAGIRVGVAHNNIRLVSLRVLNTLTGAGNVYDQVTAIRFATNLPAHQRIHILNASLGGRDNHLGRLEAIRQFPGLFVAAAGNSGSNNDINPFFPASHRLPNLISVGASNINDQRSSFSNFGATTVCIFAPGGEGTLINTSILSAFPANRCDGTIHAPSGFRNCEVPFIHNGVWDRSHIHYANGYHLMEGTSMAAPHVAGAIALIMSHRPNLSRAQIRNAIMNSVNRDVCAEIRNGSVSGGILNVYGALRIAEVPASQSILGPTTAPAFSMVTLNINPALRSRHTEWIINYNNLMWSAQPGMGQVQIRSMMPGTFHINAIVDGINFVHTIRFT